MDVVFLLVVGAFFALAVLTVRGCDLLLGPGEERHAESEKGEETP